MHLVLFVCDRALFLTIDEIIRCKKLLPKPFILESSKGLGDSCERDMYRSYVGDVTKAIGNNGKRELGSMLPFL